MLGLAAWAWLHAQERTISLGLFEGQSDVGSVTPAGTASFSPATGIYTLTAAGANTWYHVDNFHYLWATRAQITGISHIAVYGRDAKWQLNLLDPDGTRAEIMELHAIGTPCCSPFTASDPRK
jgi:hypothetical protein